MNHICILDVVKYHARIFSSTLKSSSLDSIISNFNLNILSKSALLDNVVTIHRQISFIMIRNCY